MKPHKNAWKPPRCSSSGKVAHKTPNSALAALLSFEHSKAWDGQFRHVYECPKHPGEWLFGRPKRSYLRSGGEKPRWRSSAHGPSTASPSVAST